MYTDRVGAIFDASTPEPTLLVSEPVILDGVRALVTGGILEGWAPSEERMIGFRRLPLSFGGGFAIWSSARTYRAETFLGDLTPLAEVSASGGIRPWMGSLLLRTSLGNVLVDPATRALRRMESPGLSDGVAIDDRRAVRLDILGRASFTIDGGGTWTDVLASRGVQVSGLDDQEGNGVRLTSASGRETSLFFDRRGQLGPPPRSPSSVIDSSIRQSALPPLVFPASSRALPSEAIARAAVLGAQLPGDRLLVAREGGLQILATATVLPLDDADLAGIDEKLARCQPVPLGSGPVLLACAGEMGAEVLSLSSALGRPRLEATFPEQGFFVAGPRSRLGFVGRCGPRPPSSSDLDPSEAPDETPERTKQPEVPPRAPPTLVSRVEPSLGKDARYCARISADRWVEQRLLGDDAEALYRFVPGDDGRVTALLLTSPPSGAEESEAKEASSPPHQASSISEGMRVIRLDPEDPALGGAAFPALPAPLTEAPFQTIDADFWEDEDGAIRGWVRLPAPGDKTTPHAPIAQGVAARRLPVASRRGGRSAGVRLDRDGHIQVLPLPEGVTEVVSGGRFGLAQAVSDGVATTWETVDGGRVWTVIQGPPIGSLDPPSDPTMLVGCSAIGCTWGSGVLRLGWGGPPPTPTPPAPEAPAPPVRSVLRAPQPVKVACSIAADGAVWETSTTKSARPLSRPTSKAPSIKAAPAKVPPAKVPLAKSSLAKAPPAKSSPAKAASAKATKGPPAIPISLRLGTSASLGQLDLRRGSWSGDVWLPFQPASLPTHLAATDRSLNTTQGAVIPLLDASARAPVDLLLSIGKRRLRVGAAPRSFLPFDIAAKITVAADGPSGEIVALDADKGVVWIARGEAVSAALRLGRVADTSSTRFTLGRRIEGGGLVVVGYSITTGEVFAGDLDLARAEVGPLVALGRIDTLSDRGSPACSAQKGAIRFLADLSADLVITGRGSTPLHAQAGLATFLIEASAERLCAAGMEGGFPRAASVDLTARFGRDGGAAVRTSGKIVRGTCTLDAGAR